MDVPDYLLCRISDELMDEPVIIQSGFTFEKQEIQRHFQRNGGTCPISRRDVDPKVMIPNQHIKQASQDFLLKNPWAFEYIPGQKLQEMRM
mmetsp:Transcript_10082/g.17004  ORF Transcript_10082/g.17004 Transcript_10082/m.17004 type:complete len:91 (-) Transcript_10082:184-456(-)